MKRRNTAILIFDDVEVLDFAGPYEVFSLTDELSENQRLNVYTVAQELKPVKAKHGLSINPDYDLDGAPSPDILIIPGGDGAREVMEQNGIITWISRCAQSAEKVLSVCSGALILARAGLLDELKATTHHEVIDTLQSISPSTVVVKDQRFIDNGKIVTSAGISAGIDMSLYIIERLFGFEVVDKTADYMEYRRR